MPGSVSLKAGLIPINEVHTEEGETFDTIPGVFTGMCQYSAYYRGFNIDSKNPSEKTMNIWTSGVETWVKWVEKCGSGVAVDFWARGASIIGE